MSVKSSPAKSPGKRRMKDETITGRLEGIVLEDLIPPQEPLLNIFTFGWMEDGRLGYEADIPSHIQAVPRPIAALRVAKKKKKGDKGAVVTKDSKTSEHAAQESKKKEAKEKAAAELLDETEGAQSQTKMEERFVVKGFAAGTRHTLLFTSNVYPESEEELNRIKEEREKEKEKKEREREKGWKDEEEEEEPKKVSRMMDESKRKFRVLLAGLNQRGLCEEPGHTAPTDMQWNEDEEPVDLAAGNGISFVATRLGNIFSWGNGRFGALGHGDEESSQQPRQLRPLRKVKIAAVACGYYHAIATSADGILYSWGRNNKGQLCRGFESEMEVLPDKVVGFNWEKDRPLQTVCGAEHTMCFISRQSNDGTMKKLIYSWGDESRGQLGSGDAHTRFTPQENRWVTRFCTKNNFAPAKLVAGAYHNLILTTSAQVVSWGAGDYGQLGHGSMWDDAAPNLIQGLKGVTMVAAGARHSLAVTHKEGVLAWGYNGYGELGLGDENIRTQPTALTAFSRSLVKGIAAGDRHSVVVTSHRAVMAREDPALRPFFSVVEENVNQMVVKQIKIQMEKQGFDPDLLDDPDAAVPNQVGENDEPLRVDKFEKGLRYCMDSFVDPADWRRKSYEVCFEARLKNYHLKSVCLACARFCQSDLRLTPYVRVRSKGNTKCYCKESGRCVCYWSFIRSKFDLVAGEDGCIAPKQIRRLLIGLRNPAPVEMEDVEECLVELAESSPPDADLPRVAAVPFEKWYRQHFDEFEDDAKA